MNIPERVIILDSDGESNYKYDYTMCILDNDDPENTTQYTKEVYKDGELWYIEELTPMEFYTETREEVNKWA